MKLTQLSREDVNQNLLSAAIATGRRHIEEFTLVYTDVLREIHRANTYVLRNGEDTFILSTYSEDMFKDAELSVGIEVLGRIAHFLPNLWECSPTLVAFRGRLGLEWGPVIDVPYVENEGLALIELVKRSRNNYISHIRGGKSKRFEVTFKDNATQQSCLEMLDDVVAVLDLCGLQRAEYLRSREQVCVPPNLYTWIFHHRNLFRRQTPAGIMTVHTTEDQQLIGFLSWHVLGSAGYYSCVAILKRQDLNPLSLYNVTPFHLVHNLFQRGCQRVYLGMNMDDTGEYKQLLFPHAKAHGLKFLRPRWGTEEEAAQHLESEFACTPNS